MDNKFTALFSVSLVFFTMQAYGQYYLLDDNSAELNKLFSFGTQAFYPKMPEYVERSDIKYLAND